MKHGIIIVMIGVLIMSMAAPVLAEDKRQENNKKIAEFILDTIKFPLVLIGAFVEMDHEKAKAEVEYKGHKGLKEALR